MSSNFESLDNLELQMRKSSVVQERAGLVAVHMYKQYLDYQKLTLNMNDTFSQMIQNMEQVVSYLKQSFNVRNMPTQNITYSVDNNKTVAMINILWHIISFTTYYNVIPKALPRENGDPLFCGRIFAVNGNFYKITEGLNPKDQDAHIQALLDNEIASLYIPPEKTRHAIITIKHKDNQEFYISQVDAGREFLLKVIEIVCAGGDFHIQ